ncbi:hypothetical protein [Lentzea sp. NEAU-D7]|nr:hypothetical protein [Lentzea sp. NEAU-D7]MCX2954197.1 hypothetical protein [Lentzea sp. NEAU-D7]
MVAALIASDVRQSIGRITGNPFLSVKARCAASCSTWRSVC